MRKKLLIPFLVILWINAHPYPSWTGDMKAGDPEATPAPQIRIQDKPANPSFSTTKPAQGATPENKNPDPESQTAPALRIQEGTNAEG
jgi:hypothetical protein